VKLERINRMDNQQGNLPYNLEQVMEPVAYTIGALLGDGSVKHHVSINSAGIMSKNYMVVIANMDRECVDRVCGELNRFCNTQYDVKEFINPNGTTMYRLAINNENIFTFFYYFIQDKMFIADEIFRASREARLNFIAGLFDTDGSIAQYSGYYRISYAARLRTLVEDVARLLQKLGVKVGKIHEQVSGYGTTIYVIKPNIRSFIDSGCYFYIQRKADRLYKYLNSVR
jgi:DNA-binding transcriptional regulator WhiA